MPQEGYLRLATTVLIVNDVHPQILSDVSSEGQGNTFGDIRLCKKMSHLQKRALAFHFIHVS
ncbi:MAG: hypothetical protein A2Z71_07070 [Chloroflexi bacterium RBG_13_50_21]|nr:MAG: hypothetical protein A2Z71_07070 [Chloroflexi bacterium RBG_13_50_21]